MTWAYTAMICKENGERPRFLMLQDSSVNGVLVGRMTWSDDKSDRILNEQLERLSKRKIL